MSAADAFAALIGIAAAPPLIFHFRVFLFSLFCVMLFLNRNVFPGECLPASVPPDPARRALLLRRHSREFRGFL